MADPNEDPAARAKKLLAQMNITEKIVMLHGTGVPLPYIGNVNGNERLGIPPIKLNDGPQGFRDTENGNVGTSTAFPSGMTVGLTWDPKLVFAWGEGMGKEFYDKGSNVQLGPGLCVARVPKNGRNFEYISGEDPYLGMILGGPAISGIQSQGVIANAKHWVNNNQETDRFTISEDVDERTRFEMYYPPFEGAIAANVGSMMCSYNKINDVWSCENPKTLARDLKQRLGFKGWVMSDWDATHSTSIEDGLDMEMPGFDFMGTELTELVADGNISESTVDESIMRILTPMFEFGLFDNPTNGSLQANVTSEKHNALVRDLAGAATVLLKNKDGLLPLDSSVSKVAVIGSEAIQPTVHGGGSGEVLSYYTSAPLNSIRAAMGLEQASPSNNCSDGGYLKGINFGDTDAQTQADAKSVEECCALCASNFACRAFSFVDDSTCVMKSIDQEYSANASVISGTCRPAAPKQECNEDGSKCVYFASTPEEAAAAAANADVVMVFIATTATEGADRGSLGFGDEQDALVNAAAGANSNVIVSVVAPGMVLMPWSQNDNVSAILYAGLPGQEYGNAIVDVLSGKVNPSARLSFTMPNIDNEQNFTKEQWPGVDGEATYSEKLLFGYRYYDAYKITPRFAFGHGLSYTEFAYNDVTVTPSDVPSKNTVSFNLTNIGPLDGAEVAQMYVQFPDAAGEPPLQLKGFTKVELARGESGTVEFKTNDRTFSIWDSDVHDWKILSGDYRIFVGASSRDIRLKTVIHI